MPQMCQSHNPAFLMIMVECSFLCVPMLAACSADTHKSAEIVKAADEAAIRRHDTAFRRYGAEKAVTCT
jgi:hypothetical protein